MTARAILLGVGGGIAAFKAAALCSRLVQDGYRVRVAMTAAAREFIGARTFEGLTGSVAILSATQVDPDGSVPHVTAVRDADLLVVAPATADLIARMAVGLCSDPVSLAAVATRGARLICPAMNDAMWESAVVQRNLRVLRDDGFQVLGPVEGYLAEGYAGIGRMAEPDDIAEAVARILEKG